MLLGGMKLREIVGTPRAYLVTALRLVVFPLAVVLVFAFSGITRLHPEAGEHPAFITTLAAASASATTITQFAQLYDNKPGYTSVISILTVIFCILTIPLITVAIPVARMSVRFAHRKAVPKGTAFVCRGIIAGA